MGSDTSAVNSKFDIGIGWPDYYKGNVLAFGLFLIYVLYIYLQGGFRIPSLGSVRFEFWLGAVLAVAGLSSYFRNPYRGRSGLTVWATSFIAVLMLMTFASHVPSHSFDIFVDRVLKFSALSLFIVAFVTTPLRLVSFIGAFLLACMKMGQEGALGTLTGSLLWEDQGLMRLHGVTPFYVHPNSFSGMALGCLPFCLYFFRISGPYMRIVLALQIILMLNIVVFSASRTAYVAFAIFIAVLVWRSKRRVAMFLLASSLTLAALITIVPSDYLNRAESIFSQEDKEGHSIEKRKEIWRDAWEVFVEDPMGIGVGAFPAVRKERFGRSQDTHSLYLEVATNLGVQGLVVFLGFVVAMLKSLSQLREDFVKQKECLEHSYAVPLDSGGNTGAIGRQHRDLRVLKATCASVEAFLLVRLGLGLFGMDLYEIYWWFALGLTLALGRINVVCRRRTEALCTKE